MYLPKKLATTMGIELTFMPQMFEDIYIDSKGKVSPWEMSGESSARHMFAAAFDSYNNVRNYDDNKGVWKRKLFYKIGTDPHCVEASTRPFATANGLRVAVREGYHIARTLRMSPRTIYTDGGGAHIHTGIPYKAHRDAHKRDVYTAAMYLWAAENPWMAWAFAGKKDESNANAIRRDEVLRVSKMQNRDVCYDIMCAHRDMLFYKGLVAEITERMHKKESWSDSWERRRRQSDVREYQQSYMQYYLRFQRMSNKLIADMRVDLEAFYAEQAKPASSEYPMVHAGNVGTKCGKGTMLRVTDYGDNGTLEFRCFLMPETAAAMDRHIMLVDAIVRRAKHIAETNEDGMLHEPCDVGDLLKMKYSRAKMGFRSMLVDLDLNPDEYRAECVNIALRMRARRNSYYV